MNTKTFSSVHSFNQFACTFSDWFVFFRFLPIFFPFYSIFALVRQQNHWQSCQKNSPRRSTITKNRVEGEKVSNREGKKRKNGEYLFLFNATYCRPTVNMKSAHDLYKKISIYAWIFLNKKQPHRKGRNNNDKEEKVAKLWIPFQNIILCAPI